MAMLVHYVGEQFKRLETGVSPEVDSWPLMKTPATPLIIFLVYISFVLKIGPSIMKNRKPFELKNTLIVYNGLQVLISIFLVWGAAHSRIPFFEIFSSDCEEKHFSPEYHYNFTSTSWWYHLAKIIELLDTVFFILRKRSRQVTGLHVYHHSITMTSSWLILKYSSCDQGAFIGLINSFVHVIMYFYYMISAMGPEYQKYIWWKKYITTLQLVQFAAIVVHLLLLNMSSCVYSKPVTAFFVSNALIFFYMFFDFYKKSYSKSSELSLNGQHKAANGNAYTKPLMYESYAADSKAYVRISKDAALLTRAEKMCKPE